MNLADMKRRAIQHASYGNYWAAKAVSLLNYIEQLEIELRIMHDMAMAEEEGGSCEHCGSDRSVTNL